MANNTIKDQNLMKAFQEGYDSYWDEDKTAVVYELTVSFEDTCLLVKQYPDLLTVTREAVKHLEQGPGIGVAISCFIPTNGEIAPKEDEDIIDGTIVE